MKKLGKKVHNAEATIEAYCTSCSNCGCGCHCIISCDETYAREVAIEADNSIYSRGNNNLQTNGSSAAINW